VVSYVALNGTDVTINMLNIRIQNLSTNSNEIISKHISQPASYPMGSGGALPGGKVAGA
jgi:hypothetical protein